MASAGRAAVTATVVAAAMATTTAGAAAQQDPVVDWLEQTAVGLRTTDPRGPLEDLRPLGRMVAGASVVGLGESSHGSHEQFRLKHRIARYLVEQRGFRTIAFEQDFAGGVAIDRYVVSGKGDPDALVRDMSSPMWAAEEIRELLLWMREYNRTHPEKVRFLGTDVLTLRENSFTEVTGYVRRAAPERADELEQDLALVRPTRPRYEHMRWYFGLPEQDKQRLIAAARRVSALVEGIPAKRPRLEREYAEQHARAILGWYENYVSPEMRPERERFIADTILWWQRLQRGRVAYWAASAHTASAPVLTYRMPGESHTLTMAGGHLRERLGRRYVSVGVLFHHGVMTSDFTDFGPHPVSAPPPHIADAKFGAVSRPDFYVDLHARAPLPVREWLDGPAQVRMIHPHYKEDDDGSGYVMVLESLSRAFDVLAHVRVSTPSTLL
ncbi:MAG: erythromycin esterase family protein [Thermocrispum sp.]